MISVAYRNNRAALPRSELEMHRGRWIAFNPEGTRIVASGETLDQVEELVKAAGEDPNEVVLERAPGVHDDIHVGGEAIC